MPATIAKTLLSLRRGAGVISAADFEHAWGRAEGDARATLLALVAAYEVSITGTSLQSCLGVGFALSLCGWCCRIAHATWRMPC